MKKFLFIIILILLFSLGALYLNRYKIRSTIEKHFYKLTPPKRKIYKLLNEKERNSVKLLSKKIKAKLVWASNRGGNHDIYLLDLSKETLKNLTNHPHQDLCPKFSPDGEWVAFIRSQRGWVSFREEGAWDIYVINPETGEERFITSATYPTWTSDSRNIVFSKDNVVYKINIYTMKQELIFDGTKPPVNGNCGEPSLSRDGSRIAFGTRTQAFKGIGVLDLTNNELIKFYHEGGCHVSFGPGSHYICWIGYGGKGETQVFYSTADKVDTRVLIDLPSEYSHEYFPRISNDEKWLVWGASKEGHEHDAADYEIFFWEIGSPWENYIRFTYSEANDQWPDLFVSK